MKAVILIFVDDNTTGVSVELDSKPGYSFGLPLSGAAGPCKVAPNLVVVSEEAPASHQWV